MVKYTEPLSKREKEIIIKIFKGYPELIEDLKSDDLDKFFSKIFTYSDFYQGNIALIIQLLYESGTDVLSYLDFIPPDAFIYRSIEKEFIVPKHIKLIGGSAFQASDITNLKFKENSQLKEIRAYAFYGTKISGEIYLPDSIETLYLSAFLNTKVKTINAPKKCIIKDYSMMKGEVDAKLVAR